MNELGNPYKQEIGRWASNPVENSHLPSNDESGAMLLFRRMKSLQLCLGDRPWLFDLNQSNRDSRHVRHGIDVLEIDVGIDELIDTGSIDEDVFLAGSAAPAVAQRDHAAHCAKTLLQ